MFTHPFTDDNFCLVCPLVGHSTCCVDQHDAVLHKAVVRGCQVEPDVNPIGSGVECNAHWCQPSVSIRSVVIWTEETHQQWQHWFTGCWNNNGQSNHFLFQESDKWYYTAQWSRVFLVDFLHHLTADMLKSLPCCYFGDELFCYFATFQHWQVVQNYAAKALTILQHRTFSSDVV